ncbi:MAG: LysR family transcriptional regulator [Rhodospirillaceae bacterium]|nr:LysR family transcriptional regulator [Rhodospirillaceae bacterium]
MSWRRLPPLHAVRAFEAAARHLSMTRAADELGVTAGAVSRHIRALEDHLQAALFVRRSHGLELTSSGEALAQAAFEGLDRIADAASGLKHRSLRRLAVGVYGSFASRLLLPLWPALRAQHPDLQIDLHTSMNPVELLPSRYDAVIAVADRARRTGLVSIPLTPISTVPVCAPELLEQGPPDFRTAPLLHARPRPDDWRRWLDHAGLGSVAVQGGSTFESLNLAFEAAEAGMGFAIGIEALLGRDLAAGRIVIAHESVRPTRRYFVLQYEARVAGDPALKAFSDFLQERLVDRPSP